MLASCVQRNDLGMLRQSDGLSCCPTTSESRRQSLSIMLPARCRLRSQTVILRGRKLASRFMASDHCRRTSFEVQAQCPVSTEVGPLRGSKELLQLLETSWQDLSPLEQQEPKSGVTTNSRPLTRAMSRASGRIVQVVNYLQWQSSGVLTDAASCSAREELLAACCYHELLGWRKHIFARFALTRGYDLTEPNQDDANPICSGLLSHRIWKRDQRLLGFKRLSFSGFWTLHSYILLFTHDSHLDFTFLFTAVSTMLA